MTSMRPITVAPAIAALLRVSRLAASDQGLVTRSGSIVAGKVWTVIRQPTRMRGSIVA
jgi:hypothetical protein